VPSSFTDQLLLLSEVATGGSGTNGGIIFDCALALAGACLGEAFLALEFGDFAGLRYCGLP
jgi:hypothetical protein